MRPLLVHAHCTAALPNSCLGEDMGIACIESRAILDLYLANLQSSSQQAGTTRNSMPVSLSRSSSHILYARWAPQIPCSFLEGARSETNEVILRKQDRASHSVDLYMTMFYFTNTSKLKYGELGLQSRRVARRKCIPGLSYLALNRKRNGVSASATCGL
jgi:hypothetical protein